MTDTANYAIYKMSHVQAEMNYLRATIEEQKAIIKQLTDGPGDVTYIHPFDLYELIENMPVSECFIFDHSPDSADYKIGGPFGETYRQSALIPAKSKNFK